MRPNANFDLSTAVEVMDPIGMTEELDDELLGGGVGGDGGGGPGGRGGGVEAKEDVGDVQKVEDEEQGGAANVPQAKSSFKTSDRVTEKKESFKFRALGLEHESSKLDLNLELSGDIEMVARFVPTMLVRHYIDKARREATSEGVVPSVASCQRVTAALLFIDVSLGQRRAKRRGGEREREEKRREEKRKGRRRKRKRKEVFARLKTPPHPPPPPHPQISGFTPLSARLGAQGAVGIERLSRILNDYFSSQIALVTGHGGDM